MIGIKQPIVHKLLIGADAGLLLPFARSRLRALARMFGPARSFCEKYWVPMGDSTFTVLVSQAPPAQFVTIRPVSLATPAISPAGTDVWYDVGAEAVIPWQAYAAKTFLDTPNSGFSLDDNIDAEEDFYDGERSAWWQITAAANATLDADLLQSDGTLANLRLDIITTDMAIGTLGVDPDFSDTYSVASGTTSVSGVALVAGKTYWIRAAYATNTDATYRLRVTVTL